MNENRTSAAADPIQQAIAANWPSVNALAAPLVGALIGDAASLRLGIERLANGCVVVDSGIPHRGGPLSEAFNEAFQGKLFIVSTGPNRWGLPHEDQLKRLNGTVYRTDKNGTIIVESDSNTLKVVSWIPNGN